ncbi:MAG: hypothetical protein RLZZ501_1976, partial [Pseudomonadota bacterium]
MADFPPKPSQEELDCYFPRTIEPPPDGEFELGLVMGGTVSAGAYTAGVLDFLFLALDSWRGAVAARDPQAPTHKVRLKAVSGTSGGAVCAAIATVAAGLKFPYGAVKKNPFYQLWVDTLDIEGMLKTFDLVGGKPLASLLNVAPINKGARQIILYDPSLNGSAADEAADETVRVRRREEWAARDWLDPDLTVFLTVTNLRGTPYSTPYADGRQYYYDHADFARFQVKSREEPLALVRKDSFLFDLRATRERDIIAQRRILADYAVASGAFPVGFTARDLHRPVEHYNYRVLVTTGRRGQAKVVWHSPDWQVMAGAGELPPQWCFPAYDGGVINNQPVAMVHSTLAGQIGSNERGGRDRVA